MSETSKDIHAKKAAAFDELISLAREMNASFSTKHRRSYRPAMRRVFWSSIEEWLNDKKYGHGTTGWNIRKFDLIPKDGDYSGRSKESLTGRTVNEIVNILIPNIDINAFEVRASSVEDTKVTDGKAKAKSYGKLGPITAKEAVDTSMVLEKIEHRWKQLVASSDMFITRIGFDDFVLSIKWVKIFGNQKAGVGSHSIPFYCFSCDSIAEATKVYDLYANHPIAAVQELAKDYESLKNKVKDYWIKDRKVTSEKFIDFQIYNDEVLVVWTPAVGELKNSLLTEVFSLDCVLPEVAKKNKQQTTQAQASAEKPQNNVGSKIDLANDSKIYTQSAAMKPTEKTPCKEANARSSVVQDWVSRLTMMQQTVLLTALRGPDGVAKDADCKYLLRWYRRCILKSAMDGAVLSTPFELGGGTFMGPVPTQPPNAVLRYFNSMDSLPHHYQMHFMHAVEILGYKHPHPEIAASWMDIYKHYVQKMHLNIETEEQLDFRLGDNEAQWAATQLPPDGD